MATEAAAGWSWGTCSAMPSRQTQGIAEASCGRR